ncbi:MAG: TetR/AcrR family transcriptional regulator [Kutzneria sp.]|nr:TetR/AcrR family transcriptional regulator [Kutzneria sp.]
MARAVKHDTTALLNAATRLVGRHGPAGVTMAAVAREAGAPSGSVYHRFPTRTALLAALWLRTVHRFQEGFLTAVTERSPVRAACHVVAWCRTHPEEARVLLAGAAAFDEENWPEHARADLRAANRRVADALRNLAVVLPLEIDRLALITVDLPYAVVRRALQSGRSVSVRSERLVADCAATLLGSVLQGAG